ncbi:MAG: NUDIX hydrolase [Maricaulaceae bacterium]
MNEKHTSIEAVQCVGVMCFRPTANKPEVLLIKRGTTPRKGEWSIPGGRIELGESDRDAAIRELFEETGVSAKLGAKIDIIEAEFDGVLYHLHDFAARWVSGDPRAGDDAAEAKFVALADITALNMWPQTEDIINRAYAQMAEQNSLSSPRKES